MNNTIARLWYGDGNPARRAGQNSAEIKELEALIQRNHEKLHGSLHEQQRAILEAYHDCMDEYVCITTEQAFCDGFCLGAKLTAEALTADL